MGGKKVTVRQRLISFRRSADSDVILDDVVIRRDVLVRESASHPHSRRGLRP